MDAELVPRNREAPMFNFLIEASRLAMHLNPSSSMKFRFLIEKKRLLCDSQIRRKNSPKSRATDVAALFTNHESRVTSYRLIDSRTIRN